MNVIISNKYEQMLSTLQIETIRTMNGVFTVEELSDEFKNFFYNKMIIDITAIKNYDNVNTMRELSINFDMSKLPFSWAENKYKSLLELYIDVKSQYAMPSNAPKNARISFPKVVTSVVANIIISPYLSK